MITDKMTAAGVAVLRSDVRDDVMHCDIPIAARQRLVGRVFDAMRGAEESDTEAAEKISDDRPNESDSSLRQRVREALLSDATDERRSEVYKVSGAELDRVAESVGVRRR